MTGAGDRETTPRAVQRLRAGFENFKFSKFCCAAGFRQRRRDLRHVEQQRHIMPLMVQAKTRGAWVPPAHLLVAAALLLISCIRYLHKPTGEWEHVGQNHFVHLAFCAFL